MQTLAFLRQKGGSGRTILAVHTAAAAHESGEQVVIVDTDLQKSATTWSEARQSDTPPVAPVAAASLLDVMAAARHDAMTLCIIDTAPHAAPDAARLAALADLVVIPCRPTAFDLAAANSAFEIVKAAGVSAVFVLSACPFGLLLASCGLEVAPVAVTERRAFARAVATGRAVTEFDPQGKAAEEIRALWQWLKEQMANGKNDRISSIHAPQRASRA